MAGLQLDQNFSEIQGNILADYGMPVASYLFFHIDGFHGRAWLKKLAPLLTTATYWKTPESQRPAATVNIAFTWRGLKALGLSEQALQSFSAEFIQGMAARADILGDTGDDAPAAWEPDFASDSLHVLLIINAQTSAFLAAKLREVRALDVDLDGVREVHAEDGALPTSGPLAFREHFGFADGIGQPVIAGSGLTEFPGRGTPRAGGWDAIKPGEFIFGYDDESNSGAVAAFPNPDALGLNGTYLVFRKLEQRVFQFRSFLKEMASSLYGSSDSAFIELLAAKMVGRWRSGAPLALSPNADDATLASDPQRNNDFRFAHDPQGLAVPLGAHIRRVNPRDGLDNTDVLVKRHRLMRRGLPYGPVLPPDSTGDDGQKRGVLFIALNSNISGQFEFVQREWINRGNIFNLTKDERDPVVAANGGTGIFTLPGAVPPFLFNLQTFVAARGGEYFFMPSATALRGIAEGRFMDIASASFLSRLHQVPASEQAALVNSWLGAEHENFFTELRAHQPVLKIPGIVIASTYTETSEILAHDDIFSVRLYGPRMQRLAGQFFLGMENSPQYERELSIMRLVCRRDDLERIATLVRETGEQCVRDVVTTGRIEIVSQLTRIVPARLIADYFGVPGPNLATLQRWMRSLFWDIFLNLSDTAEIRAAADLAAGELKQYLSELIDRRRGELTQGRPMPDDVLTRLIRISANPEVDFKTDDIIRNISGLIIGALETTSQAVVQALDQLVDRPELAAAQDAARTGSDETLRAYLYEALRFRPQNPFLYRICEKPYVLARGTPRATPVEPGTFVIAATSSAMLDASVLATPSAFRLDRPKEHYMLFGQGLHTCFGRYINGVTIPGIAKVLLRLKGLRRSSGSAGQIAFEGPFPSSMNFQFDAGQPLLSSSVNLSARINREPSMKPVLITIPPSLGSECTRWILQHHGYGFVEQRHAILLVNDIVKQMGGTEYPALVLYDRTISTTDLIYAYSEPLAPNERKLKNSVPFADDEIALGKEVLSLGESSTCWGYFNLLPQREVMIPVFQNGLTFEEQAFAVDRFNDTVAAMTQFLKLTPENAAAGLAHAQRVFALVEKQLAKGRKYLMEDRFTITDLIFAVQAAPFTFPAEYGGALPAYAQIAPNMQNIVKEMRETVAGQYALRMYREERRRFV